MPLYGHTLTKMTNKKETIASVDKNVEKADTSPKC